MAFQVRDNRGGNWFWLHNAIIDHYGKELGPYGIAVYAALCRHAGQEQQTWISQGKIAEEIGTTRQQVNKLIAQLEVLQLLRVEDRQDDVSGRTTSIYSLLELTPVVQDDRGVIVDDSPSQSRRQALSSTMTAMINKTHGTKTMEQDGATDLEKLWHMTLTDLREQMVPSNFTRWVARTFLLSHEAGAAVVGVPDQVSADQLARRFDPLVRRALADACGETVTVQYQVIEA